MCLEFIETVGRETILIDARRAALKIQASTAKVILIFCWYTDVKKVFLELAKIHVSNWHGFVYIPITHRDISLNKYIVCLKRNVIGF